MTKISFEELAESLAHLGRDKAKDRLSFLRKEKLLSDFQYVALLHLVNGGDPKLTQNLERQADKDEPEFTSKDEKIGEVIVAAIITITTVLVIYSCGGVQ